MNRVDMTLLKKMSRSLIHRGPEKTYYFGDNTFCMGINRLATIGKNVEYPLEYNGLYLVFNGDIFNYKELRKDLINKGHKFKTDCDGEVIVIGYKEWGVDVVKKLRGQFAILLYDSIKKEIFLVRDRFGICPLYYINYNNIFYVSSEIKAFKGIIPFKIKKSMLPVYYTFDCVPAPYTLLKGIYKLEPGHYLIYNLEINISYKIKYWEPSFTGFNNSNIPGNTYVKLKKAVELSSIADYPVGVYLSGGMDSSTITSFMSKINPNLHTFSVHFKSDTVKNETTDAIIVSKYFKTKHHEVHIGKEVLKDLPKIIYYMDEPIPNFTAIALFNLSKLVRKTGIKIVLDGSGGDELFGGYTMQNTLIPLAYKYKMFSVFSPIIKLVNIFTKNKYINKAAMLSLLMSKPNKFYNSLVHGGKHTNIYQLYNLFNKSKNPNLINQIIEADIKITLSNQYLHMSDRMAMSNSVVLRCPLLNKELVEYAFKLPIKEKMLNGVGKISMRNAMKADLPKHTLNKTKAGFVAPLRDWWPRLRELYSQYLPSDPGENVLNSDIKIAFQDIVLNIWKKQMGVNE